MAGIYMGHFDYLRDKLDINPVKENERFEECLAAMEKYPTPWWYDLRHNHEELAACQIDEPVLLIRWYAFKDGVEKVLGRKLAENELHSQNTALLEEFREKYQRLKWS